MRYAIATFCTLALALGAFALAKPASGGCNFVELVDTDQTVQFDQKAVQEIDQKLPLKTD